MTETPLRRVRRGLARLALAIAAALPLWGYTSIEALFAPKAELWARWQSHDAANQETIDHGIWADLLGRYVTVDPDGVNRFDYAEVGVTEQAALRAYIEGLTALPISAYGRAEQLAYWINLYNALTVRVVLDAYPVDSIRDIDISPGLFADGPWGRKLVRIEGEDLSLNDIEHRILRPIWRDPRIHYAVNCAAIGCPNLPATAFTGETVDARLEQAARDYVNHPRGSRVAGGRLLVSSIYVWFQEDFGGDDRGVIAHLKRYAEPDLAAQLMGLSEIDGHDYDWRLNDIGPGRNR